MPDCFSCALLQLCKNWRPSEASRVCLHRMPGGLLASLFQKCAALKSQRLVSAINPNSARMTSIGVFFQKSLLTPAVPCSFCMCLFTSPAFCLHTFWENSLAPHTSAPYKAAKGTMLLYGLIGQNHGNTCSIYVMAECISTYWSESCSSI